MSRRFVLATTLSLTAFVFLANGCATQPQATPQATPTENVVVVVVTSTAQPTLAPTDTEEATITPLATFTPIGLQSPTPTARATSTLAATKIPVASTPKATKTQTPVPATATPVQDKYPAPTGISPSAGDSNNDNSDIQFKYFSVGPLVGNECYLLHVQMVVPNAPLGGVAGDDFLDVKNCGNMQQSPEGTRLTFVLFRPRFGSPTYGGIERLAGGFGGSSPWKIQWYARVVQNNGISPDGVHYNTIPLSPNGPMLESEFLH